MEQDPPRPRKLPKQQRSKLLFSSIKEACRQILEDKGVEDLSIARVAEVAGISVGSFYQYFPNLDAVVYEIYRDDQPSDNIIIADLRMAMESASSLEDALKSVIDFGVSYHKQRLSLESDFYRLYHEHFGIVGRMRYSDIYLHMTDLFRKMLVEYEKERDIQSIDIKAFLLLESLQVSLHQALERHAEYLDSDEFKKIVLKMCLGIIDPS